MSSLTDAFLLDPYPFEIWIAYRTDGLKGTGTLNDPLNGAPKLATPFQVTVLTNSGQETTATAPSHNFANGDVVVIAGVTGNGAVRWNGAFPVYGVSGNQFKYYMTAVPGAAATLDASSNASKVTTFSFDDRMNELPANSRVHVGPTPVGQPFLTRGYADGVSGGWQPKRSMKILGAGIDATVLRLVPAAVANAQFFAIGHALVTGSPPVPNLLDFVEVSDLTVDCNLTIASGTAVTCGAARLFGNHAWLRRIRVTGWGTNDVQKTCQVLAVLPGDTSAGAAQADDCGIEESVADSPATSPANAPVIVLHAGAKGDAGAGQEVFGKGPVIRNCFVDCGWPGATAESRGLSMNWCRGGIVEGNQVYNTKYGGPYQAKASGRDMIVRNNHYKNVAKGPFLNLGTKSGTTVTISALTFASVTGGYEATVTTSADHNLALGDRIEVLCNPSSLNGLFLVTQVTDTRNFKYKTPANGTFVSGTMERVYGAGKLLIEGNVIELATGSDGQIGIHVHDNAASLQAPDYVHSDVLIRNNKIRYFDGQFDTGYVGSGIEVDGVKNANVSHNLAVCAPSNPLKNFRCGTVTYFNNKTPMGALIQGYNGAATTKYSELETESEDALVLTLI